MSLTSVSYKEPGSGSGSRLSLEDKGGLWAAGNWAGKAYNPHLSKEKGSNDDLTQGIVGSNTFSAVQ